MLSGIPFWCLRSENRNNSFRSNYNVINDLKEEKMQNLSKRELEEKVKLKNFLLEKENTTLVPSKLEERKRRKQSWK